MEEQDDKEEGETDITPEMEEETDTQGLTQTQDGGQNSKSQSLTHGTQDGTQNEKPDFSNVCTFYTNTDCKFRAKC